MRKHVNHVGVGLRGMRRVEFSVLLNVTRIKWCVCVSTRSGVYKVSVMIGSEI